jgi:hypothetical protein
VEAKDRANLDRWIAEEQVPQVALHEAGHVVVMVLTGAGIRDVFLRPADEEFGLFMGQANPANVFAVDDHQKAMIAVAGLLAESIRRGESTAGFIAALDDRLDPEGEEDISGLCDERALRVAQGNGVDLERAVREAWALLTGHWPAVEAIASALVAKWTPDGPYALLSADDVAEAMKTGRPPR